MWESVKQVLFARSVFAYTRAAKRGFRAHRGAGTSLGCQRKHRLQRMFDGNRLMNVRQTDSRFLVRDSPAEDLQIARSSGSFLFDARGRRYIDFVMGWCVGNFGWDNNA